MIRLLTNAQMRAADGAAVALGVSALTLMEAAGWQVAQAIRRRFLPRAVVVLCGPGNNGGDGYVVARRLAAKGWPVKVARLGEAALLRGDAATVAARWTGPTVPLDRDCLSGRPLVVDALFGAGLSRPLDGVARDVIEEIAARDLDMVAVDVPSGIDGDSGRILGAAAPARLTVTFFRAKPGHVLLPARDLVGERVVADIGIPPGVLNDIAPRTFINQPELWRHAVPWPESAGNKYHRGHLVVAAGAMTGAARLVALAGRRAGAGLVTIAAPPDLLGVLRSSEPGNIVQPIADWPRLLADQRYNALVIGPGLGVGEAARGLVLTALEAGKACVVDADALSSFAGFQSRLWQAGGCLVLTPHDGEYKRLFSHDGDRLTRARKAASESGAVVLLKGADTVVAAPDGRAAISVNAPPSLATGGSGDVLAGMIGGLLAQGVAPFEAAAMAVWMHGEAATRFGPGLIAEDLAGQLPGIWASLYNGL